MRKGYLIGFFLVLSLDIIGGTFEPWEQWHWFAKPLIIPFLIAGFRDATKGFSGIFKNGILAALVLSWLGDILLMFTSENPIYFQLGLGSFLTAHLAYIFAFYKSINKSISFTELSPLQLISYAAIISFAIVFFVILMPYLGDLLIPVSVYIIVISLMAIIALSRLGGTPDYSFKTIVIGALLFLTSDSLLAYNKFISALEAESLLIMSTYGLAQLFICLGAINHITRSEQHVVE